MVSTNRADLWDAMWAFKDHGKTQWRLSGANIPRLPFAEALADCSAERLPVARELGETCLMFLVHPTITPEQMAAYAEAVRSVVTGGLVKAAWELLRLQFVRAPLGCEFSAAGGPQLGSGGGSLRSRGQAQQDEFH